MLLRVLGWLEVWVEMGRWPRALGIQRHHGGLGFGVWGLAVCTLRFLLWHGGRGGGRSNHVCFGVAQMLHPFCSLKRLHLRQCIVVVVEPCASDEGSWLPHDAALNPD